MHHARQFLVLLVLPVIASSAAPVLWAQSAAQAQGAGAALSAPDLSIHRKRIDESNAARNSGDSARARARAAEVVTELLARPAAEQDAAWTELLQDAGLAAWYAQDPRTANSASKRVYEIRLAALPDDHPRLQDARNNLANTLYTLGDLAGARALQEKVLEVRSRTLPDDHPHLQAARGNLASTLHSQGDLAGARALREKVLEVRVRTLPDDHLDLQTARGNLANTLYAQGELAGARALQEKVLEVRLAALPDDHPLLQNARVNLANTLYRQGDLARARALQEKVLEIRSRTLPDEHPELQSVRLNLANTLHRQGDLAGARALQEKVLEIRSRTLPDEHPTLQAARADLANTLHTQGDIAGARALREKVLEVCSRTLPDDHPQLQHARNNLANTLYRQGDLAGARALQEKVLEVDVRTLPADHPDLQTARGNLAGTLHRQGDLAGARALEEGVLEVLSRTLPDDHVDLQAARHSLANTLYRQGDLSGARALREKVLEVGLAALPDDHPDLQDARLELATTIVSELARSKRGEGDRTRERARGRERCVELIGAVCDAQAHAARAVILGSPAREAEERCATLAKRLDLVMSLSFAQGSGLFEPLFELQSRVFAFAETTRGAALASAELARRAASSPRYATLREELRDAGDVLANLAQKGTTSEEFDRARVVRESVERELVALARELSGGKESESEFAVEALAARLRQREAAVGFRRYTKSRFDAVDELGASGQPVVRVTSVQSLGAFVMPSSRAGSKPAANGAGDAAVQIDSAPTPSLAFIDLGPIAPIEEASRAWREGLGVSHDSRGVAASVSEQSAPSVHAQGALLREKIFDPLLSALTGAERIVVVLDDVLHLVPLDALPLDEQTRVGDRWQIETRTTLTELLISRDAPENAGELVAFGDVAYGSSASVSETGTPGATALAAADAEPLATGGEPRATSSEPLTADVPGRAANHASILRGGAWAQGFASLPGTGVEVRGIARCFVGQFGEDFAPTLREHASATRAQLIELAPKARYLHIATHGWFAPESIRSWSDPEPLDKQSGLGMRMSGAEQVKGMSPMLMCGLALAGANLPEDAVGRAPGLVTADELSTLDLSNCELAVLSACDTNVGERRAGQGVASLQKALQMAGARSVITSLWKVPDEATKELMLDFYRGLWVEKKPKHQALWEAKTKLREAKDERGAPKYTTRDWAAWVLTGDPN